MKLLTPELLIFAQICVKSFVGWGFAPDPTGGAYSAPPDPLAAIRGPTCKWREGWGGGRKGGGRGQAPQNSGSRTAPGVGCSERGVMYVRKLLF